MQAMRITPFLLISLWGLCLGFTDGAAQVAVIAHKSVPVDTITRAEVLDLYAFENRKWRDGQPVVVLDLKPKGTVRTAFYAFLGKSPSRMKSIWLINKLAGEGEPPEALASEAAMIQRVAETPGALGFVSFPVDTDSVKVLAVIEID